MTCLKCTKCGEEKDEGEFATDRRRKTGRCAWCKECKKKSASDWYYANRQEVLDKKIALYPEIRKKNRIKSANTRKRYLDGWKSVVREEMELACCKCGYDKSFSALDFHHVGEKKMGISQIMQYKPTLQRIDMVKEELKQCIILCANCHREHHFDNINL